MPELSILEPLKLPLHGRLLIEASAGTGKTYTITTLYLRLLLGLDGWQEKPLKPEEILVVTFTDAATEELRGRIRERIIDAIAVFTEQQEDDFLNTLKAEVVNLDKAVEQLTLAARQMDQAAIFTIHSFCQRMLKNYAFESGELFTTELISNEEALIRQAVLDFWRSNIYPLSLELTNKVLECWQSPDNLIGEIKRFLANTEMKVLPDLSEVDLIDNYKQYLDKVKTFKQAWKQGKGLLLEEIKQAKINRRVYTKTRVPTWAQKIDSYVLSDEVSINKNIAKALTYFSTKAIQSNLIEDNIDFTNPLAAIIDDLLSSPPAIYNILLSKALNEVRLRLRNSKQQKQLRSFNDLISGMDNALADSASGLLLATAIRQKFPFAMIDEFQDTDPQQYRIFSTIYPKSDSGTLVMIGDPKQAIYAFRGADIFTYIKARQEADAIYTLATNWRSTAAMVDAVNQLFSQSLTPFIYDNDIQFNQVTAGNPNVKQLIEPDKESKALTLWFSDTAETLSKTDYLNTYAAATAAEIDRLLTEPVKLGNKVLSSQDMVILVRDRYEAESVRQALSSYNRASVYISNQDSVFSSTEASELALLLNAIEQPTNEINLKSALAISLLQLKLDELDYDEHRWEEIQVEFSQYKEIWLKQGVLPMLMQLLHQRQLATAILSLPMGERRLTNLLHLAELLQKMSMQLEGITSLLRWFNQQLKEPSDSNDEQILRLESERNLIRIITIHKSKGLEYPIVFIPFICAFREAKTAFYHQADGTAVLNLSKEHDAIMLADKERLAEDIRLLYVAITRATTACYMGIADLRKGKKEESVLKNSSIGHLILQHKQPLAEALQILKNKSNNIKVEPPPLFGAQVDMFNTGETANLTLVARKFSGYIDHSWHVSSYSGLTRHKHSISLEVLGLDMEVVSEVKTQVKPSVDEMSIFTFPKGAVAGTFLHSIFELKHKGELKIDAGQKLSDSLVLSGYELDWLPVIENLIDRVEHCDLDGQGLKLADVALADCLVEMEFMLEVKKLDASSLEKLIRQYDPVSKNAPKLEFNTFKGMLKGFIDLLFRHEGRYYVLDYKSNYLGDRVESYNQQAMTATMCEHRYDVQYLIYSLAVHRLLRQRIPEYSYQKHFGGVYYLFLRGIGKNNSYGVFNYRPPIELINQLDQLFSDDRELL